MVIEYHCCGLLDERGIDCQEDQTGLDHNTTRKVLHAYQTAPSCLEGDWHKDAPCLQNSAGTRHGGPKSPSARCKFVFKRRTKTTSHGRRRTTDRSAEGETHPHEAPAKELPAEMCIQIPRMKLMATRCNTSGLLVPSPVRSSSLLPMTRSSQVDSAVLLQTGSFPRCNAHL